MELVRWEPFAGLGDVRSVFDEMLDERTKPHRYPAVDVLESKDSFLIRAELPGMKREDIQVEVKDGTLVLSGERKAEKLGEGVEYRHLERVNARFSRSFSLPEIVQEDAIAASYKDGVLEVRVPKAEKAKPRQIEVTVH